MSITRDKLIEGLRQCMKKAPVEEITVRQICAAAHLSRQSFYRTCRDKYDLVNGFFDDLLMASFQEMGQGEDIHDSLIKKFTFIRREGTFFENAFRTDVQNNLKEHDIREIDAFYTSLITRKTGQKPEQRIQEILDMYCVASVYRTAKWVREGMKESEEELARIMVAAMPAELADLFENIGILNM